ncbi:MAG: YncE family protein [Verrucomicrobiales bacterium]
MVSVVLGSLGVPCPAQNFAPLAKATAARAEALVGEAIFFSSADSVDPDEMPQPLSFVWDFGDGRTSMDPNPTISYLEARAYRVTLTVSDGADAAVDTTIVHVLAPRTVVAPTKSSILALSPSEDELWVANPDSGSVSVLGITPEGAARLAEVPVGRRPRTLAFSPNGTRVYVACQEANQLWVLERSGKVVRKLAVGHEPYGVAVATADGRIVVTNQGHATVTVIAPSLVVEKVIPVAAAPRAVAITADGKAAYVSHFLTTGSAGTVTKIELAAPGVAAISPLVEDTSPDTTSSGGGFPNMLSALAVDPAGTAVWFGGLKANTSRGLFTNGETPHPENALRGFFGKLDVPGGAERIDRRIDANDTDSVSAIAFSPNGRWAYVTHQGAGTFSVYDASAATLFVPGDGNTVDFAARIDLGHAPQGIVVSDDGKRGYVSNYLSRNVQVLDLTDPQMPSVLATVAVTAEPLPPRLANGKRLFYRSRDRAIRLQTTSRVPRAMRTVEGTMGAHGTLRTAARDSATRPIFAAVVGSRTGRCTGAGTSMSCRILRMISSSTSEAAVSPRTVSRPTRLSALRTPAAAQTSTTSQRMCPR